MGLNSLTENTDSMMNLGLGFGLAGDAVGGISGFIQGGQQRRALQQNIEGLDRSFQFQSAALDRTLRTVHGQQRAAAGASGILIEGSPLQVMIDSEYQLELDRSALRYNTQLAQAQARSQMQQVQTQQLLSAGGTLLGMGTRVARQTLTRELLKKRDVGRATATKDGDE